MARTYLLSGDSLNAFLPYLYSDDRIPAQKGLLYVLGAVAEDVSVGNVAVGALAFSVQGERARIQSISVSPEYQNCGLAGTLLRDLQTILPAMDCFEIDATLMEDDPSFGIMDHVLQREGFDAENGSIYSVHKLADFQDSPLMQRARNVSKYRFHRLSDIPESELRYLNSQMLERNLIDRPMDWKNFDPKISYCSTDSDGIIRACVCASQTQNSVCVEWIYLDATHESMLLLGAMAHALDSALQIYGPNTDCTAVLLGESSEKIMDVLSDKSGSKQTTHHYILDLLDNLEPLRSAE